METFLFCLCVERVAKQEKGVIYSFGALSSSFLRYSEEVDLLSGPTYTGINGESSFEAALMDRAPGCEVWGYDFTVNSVGGVVWT